ncbi:MAG: PAS domain-containing protein, partial [Oscillochloris sp.]|nr:PAS domain-containing protein [Oscillochloris sp.]
MMNAGQNQRVERQLWPDADIEDGFALIDRDLRFVEVNASLAAINGLSIEEHVGHTISEVLPTLAPTLEPLLRQVFATGKPAIDIEIHATREIDGPLRRWSANYYPVCSRRGTVIAIDAVVHQVATLPWPSNDLLRNREHFAALVADVSPNLIYVYDLDAHRLLYTNSRFDLFFRHAQPQIAAMGAYASFGLIHPEDQAAVRYHLEQLRIVADGVVLTHTYRFWCPDSTWRWLRCHELVFQRNAVGLVTQVLGIVEDMAVSQGIDADLLMRYQAAEASQNYWRTLFNNIDRGLCILEMLYDDAGKPIDYRFLEVNPTFERHTGLKNAVGKTARELVPDLELHWVEIYAQVAETGEPLQFEQGSTAMGRWFDVDAVRVGEPGYPKVALLFTDVTARKLADSDAHFLFELSEQIRVSVDPEALPWMVTQALGQYLQVARCCVIAVDDQANRWIVYRDYRDSPTLMPIAGMYLSSPYLSDLVARLQAGRVIAIRDTACDPLTEAVFQTCFEALSIHGLVAVPLLRKGRWVASVVAFTSKPYDWAPREVALLETVAERAWNAVEQLRAAESLRSSQRNLALALQVGKAGTFEWDIRNDVNRWSPELETLYGLPCGTFEGTYAAWFQRVNPDDIHTFEAGIRAALAAHHDEHSYEFRAVLPDGSQRWLAGRARFDYDVDGTPIRMLGINVDIDQQKQNEQEVRRAHERLALALDRLDGFLYEFDVDTGYVEQSDGGARILGYEASSTPTHRNSWVELIHPDDRAIALQYVRDARVGDTTNFSLEYRVRHRDGHYLTVWDRGLIERDDLGRAIRVLGTTINITDRKQADAERVELLRQVQQALQTTEEALARAEAATRERDLLISIAAHDLRTPLTVILGQSHLLYRRAAKVGLDERTQRTLSMITGQAERLNKLIEALLDLSRIQEGRLTIQSAPCDLVVLLQRVVDEVQSTTSLHRFTLNLPSIPLLISADLL